jgi:hypothetical protein
MTRAVLDPVLSPCERRLAGCMTAGLWAASALLLLRLLYWSAGMPGAG